MDIVKYFLEYLFDANKDLLLYIGLFFILILILKIAICIIED